MIIILVTKSDDKLFIIPSDDNIHKPVKLIFENDTTFSDMNKEIRLPNDSEIHKKLNDILRSLQYKQYNRGVPITTQQYKSEKGKLRKGQNQEVLNFIKKHDLKAYAKYIRFINTEETHYDMTMTVKLSNGGMDDINKMYGIYPL